MKYFYSELKVSHTRWEGFCVNCFDTEPHATLYGSEYVCCRCMTCGRDEIMNRVR
jgi:hypothetical protein